MHCPLVLEMNDESLLESWELVWVDHLGPGLVEPLNSPFVDCRARGGGTDERGSCLTCVWGTLRDIGQFLTLLFPLPAPLGPCQREKSGGLWRSLASQFDSWQRAQGWS